LFLLYYSLLSQDAVHTIEADHYPDEPLSAR
jgi:hypothetical protein